MPSSHEALRQQFAAIIGFAAELEPLSTMPLARYVESPVIRRAVERLLQLIIEAITDAADIILREAGLEPSDAARETLARIQALGVISPPLARALMQATGLRNRLVHAYQRIDDERVLAASAELVRWAREYVGAAERWLSYREDTEK